MALSRLSSALLMGRLRTWRRPSFVFLQPAQGPLDALTGHAVTPAHDGALLAWRAWCEAHAGHRCMVGLSNQWLMNGVVMPGQANRLEAAVDAAAAQWDHYFNVDAQQLQANWCVRAVPAGEAWLVSALPMQIVADLQAVAHMHGVKVVWMGPWWAHGGQRWFNELPSGAAPDDATRTLVVQEPRWRVCFQVQGRHLLRVWAQPGLSGESQVQLDAAAPRSPASQVLWQGAECAAILSGQSPQWSLRS